MLCRNPDLAAGCARKRQDLLAGTERDLARIRHRVMRKRDPWHGATDIALAAGAVIDSHKMAKHCELTITDTGFDFVRKTTQTDAEAATDGIYVVRTSLPAETLDDAQTVRSCKSLSLVERAFRCLKTVDLHVRPVYRWLEDRVRAQVFLCMLGCYLDWHLRRHLAPVLFDDTDRVAAEALRPGVVAAAQRSDVAIRKQTTGMTAEGLPVHSLRTLLADLGTLARNTVVTALTPDLPFAVLTRPTADQQRAFALLGVALSPENRLVRRI